MDFESRLKQLRESRGLTQEELGAKLGVGKSAVSMWEKGKRKPDHEMMEVIADFFNVDMDFLYGRNYDIETDLNEMFTALRYRPEMRMLFSVSVKATKEDIEKTVRIITAIKEDC